ncbi:hypothetical protein DINM_002499 [Dirofilaria immitis]|nr:hypothetical protein [Dirofilaria immitis]
MFAKTREEKANERVKESGHQFGTFLPLFVRARSVELVVVGKWCGEVQYGAVRCSAVRCGAVRCAVRCDAVHPLSLVDSRNTLSSLSGPWIISMVEFYQDVSNSKHSGINVVNDSDNDVNHDRGNDF